MVGFSDSNRKPKAKGIWLIVAEKVAHLEKEKEEKIKTKEPISFDQRLEEMIKSHEAKIATYKSLVTKEQTKSESVSSAYRSFLNAYSKLDKLSWQYDIENPLPECCLYTSDTSSFVFLCDIDFQDTNFVINYIKKDSTVIYTVEDRQFKENSNLNGHSFLTAYTKTHEHDSIIDGIKEAREKIYVAIDDVMQQALQKAQSENREE